MFGIGPLITWQFPNWQANRARVKQARALEQVEVAQFEASVLKALMRCARPWRCTTANGSATRP